MAKSPNRIGQVVAQRYALVEIVGRGGQGTVYKAHDRWLDRPVAVKVLGAKAAREPQTFERVMRELQAVSVLKGTAAVDMLDVCRGNDGELCLVMELLTGMDLDDHLDRLRRRGERMRLERVVEIFDPIVQTLDTAHRAGILHRDLKPANIFLLDAGGVRLLDFGMARLKSAAPLTAAGMVMGSPSFMAPEAWKGMSDFLDARADVFSLGVVLFLTLTGELPFTGKTLQEKLMGVMTGKPKSLRQLRPDLPRLADDWAASALALDREQRFGSVTALWNAFFTSFRVRPPNQRAIAAFWSKAKSAVKWFGGSNPPAPVESAPAEPPPWANADRPSFTREALAQTALRREPSSGEGPAHTRAVEKTLDLHEDDLMPATPPPRRPPPNAVPPPRNVESTVSISAELVVEPGTEPPASPRDDKS